MSLICRVGSQIGVGLLELAASGFVMQTWPRVCRELAFPWQCKGD